MGFILIHWSRTHICTSKLDIIGLDNGLFGTKSLSEPMLVCCELGHCEHIPVKSPSNTIIFIQENEFENVVCKMAATLSYKKRVFELQHHFLIIMWICFQGLNISPIFGNHIPTGAGQIFWVDFKFPDKPPVPVKIVGNIDLQNFNPHGISSWLDHERGLFVTWLILGASFTNME